MVAIPGKYHWTAINDIEIQYAKKEKDPTDVAQMLLKDADPDEDFTLDVYDRGKYWVGRIEYVK